MYKDEGVLFRRWRGWDIRCNGGPRSEMEMHMVAVVVMVFRGASFVITKCCISGS